MSSIINITLIEPSTIICQGVAGIIFNAGIPHKITFLDNLRKLDETGERNTPEIVFINTALIQNQIKEFQSVRKNYPDTSWIGIVHSLSDPQVLSLLDELIYINDPSEKIIGLIQKLTSQDHKGKQDYMNLTERETDVLKLLVAGQANKEIANTLNISTHTVITHRKNITQKTGIKSVSGLTIYAVLKGIISVNDYKE